MFKIDLLQFSMFAVFNLSIGMYILYILNHYNKITNSKDVGTVSVTESCS